MTVLYGIMLVLCLIKIVICGVMIYIGIDLIKSFH